MKTRIRIALRVVIITCLVALMSSVALAQLIDDIGDGGDLVGGPGSTVPEPTAALLFAAGGLIVAGVVRKRRKS